MRTGAQRRRHRAGFTILELALVICILSVVLVAFVPTFLGELRTSKVAEASENLKRLHEAAASYYESTGTRGCLPPAAGPTPSEPSTEPVEVDFGAPDTPGADTWKALGFQPARPVRYRYSFAPGTAGCGLGAAKEAPLVTLGAEGDLDGDGTMSLFERSATVDSRGHLVPTGILHVTHRVE